MRQEVDLIVVCNSTVLILAELAINDKILISKKAKPIQLIYYELKKMPIFRHFAQPLQWIQIQS